MTWDNFLLYSNSSEHIVWTTVKERVNNVFSNMSSIQHILSVQITLNDNRLELDLK